MFKIKNLESRTGQAKNAGVVRTHTYWNEDNDALNALGFTRDLNLRTGDMVEVLPAGTNAIPKWVRVSVSDEGVVSTTELS